MTDKVDIKIKYISDDEYESFKINVKKNESEKVDTNEIVSILTKIIINMMVDCNIPKKDFKKFFKYCYKNIKEVRKNGQKKN